MIRPSLRRRALAAFSAVLALAAVLVVPNPASATAPNENLSILAGTGGSGVIVPGPATSSPISSPLGVVSDANGNVFISSSRSQVLKVTPDGTLSVVAGTGVFGAPTAGPATSSDLGYPSSLALDAAGNLYIADTWFFHVLKVTPSGTLSFVAGDGNGGWPAWGAPATESPMGMPLGLAVDSSGSVYISDGGNNMILVVPTDGTMGFFAGSSLSGAPTPGPAWESDMAPWDLAMDSADNLYISDYLNRQVLKVTPGQSLSIVAGSGASGTPTPGPATSSPFVWPSGLALDSAGNLYIADRSSSVVSRVTSDGTLSIMAGTGTQGSPSAGPATFSNLGWPTELTIDADDNLYIADQWENLVLKVELALATAPEAPTSLVATPGNGSASIAFTAGADGGAAITKYQYKVGGGSWTDAVGTSSPITISGLTNYVTTNIRLRAVNAVGDGAASAAVKVSPRLAGPTLSSAKAQGSTRIRAAIAVFTPPSGSVSHFWIYAYTKGTSTVAGSCRSTAATRSCVIVGLSAGTEYDIAARAFVRNDLLSPVRPTSDGVKQTVRTNN